MEEIKSELIDEPLKGYQKPEDLIGENGLLKQLTKAVLERALNAELTHHLGYEKHDPAGHNSGNSRNGTSVKTSKGDFGELVMETARDRNSTFEPQIDFGSHRCSHGRSKGVAEPAAGTDLRDRLSGRAVCKDAARRASGEPGGVRGDLSSGAKCQRQMGFGATVEASAEPI
jgi:mutator family transposase